MHSIPLPLSFFRKPAKPEQKKAQKKDQSTPGNAPGERSFFDNLIQWKSYRAVKPNLLNMSCLTPKSPT